MLECKNVSKSYGNKAVLENVNLNLEKGKIYGLLGRNGVGKTTLLSMMSNQTPISQGTVTVEGEPVWENPKALSHICFARELHIGSDSILENFTVKQYLKAASTFLPNWDDGAAKEYCEKFDLNMRTKLSKLSKGMLSMVTIVVALASCADYTLLDEPTAGLDVVARDMFYKLLLEVYTDSGRTFVISTHIIEEAADVMEEIILIKNRNIFLKENTQQFLDRAVCVSGLSQQVDAAAAGMQVVHTDILGRSKTAIVLQDSDHKLKENPEITVQPVSLQKLFLALCGEEGQ